MFHVPNQGAAAPGTCVPEQTGGEPKAQLLSSYAGLRQRSRGFGLVYDFLVCWGNLLACLFSGRLSSPIDRVTEVWKGVRTHLVQHSQGARRDRTSSILSVDQVAPGPTKRKLQLGMLGRIHRQIKFNQEGFLPVYMSKTDVAAPQLSSLVQLAMPSSWLISRLISPLRALQGQRNIAFSFSISSDHTAGFTLHFVPVFMTGSGAVVSITDPSVAKAHSW